MIDFNSDFEEKIIIGCESIYLCQRPRHIDGLHDANDRPLKMKEKNKNQLQLKAFACYFHCQNKSHIPKLETNYSANKKIMTPNLTIKTRTKTKNLQIKPLGPC